MNQVKIGVIGAGRMGQRHCRVYSNMRKVQLVAISDSNPDIGLQISRQYDIPYFEQVDDLLKCVDAVSLATPTPSHYDLAMRCMQSGVHLLIEKPIAETLEHAKDLACTAEDSGLIVQVGHIERFNPAYMELRNILAEIPPLAINMLRLSPYPGSNKDVDVVLDLMIHDTNLVMDLLHNAPMELNAVGLTAFSGKIDHATAQLSFENGPVVTMIASRVTEQKIRSIAVTCRDAYLECDLLNKNIYIHRSTFGEYLNANRRGVKYRQESIVERINIPSFEPLFLQLQHFVDCILDKKSPVVTAWDGYHALDLAMRIRDQVLENMVNLDRRKAIRDEQSKVEFNGIRA